MQGLFPHKMISSLKELDLKNPRILHRTICWTPTLIWLLPVHRIQMFVDPLLATGTVATCVVAVQSVWLQQPYKTTVANWALNCRFLLWSEESTNFTFIPSILCTQ